MLNVRERWTNRALFRLLWPLVIEQLLSVTMGITDTLMVSPVGEYALSSVNLIDNINNLFIIAFTALCTGGAVVVSQYIGRKDHENAGIASKQLIYSAVLVSLVIAVIAILFRRPVLRILYSGIEDDVMNTAMAYFRISALSYPMLAVYHACAALFRSVGNSKTPMLVALLINVLHIFGNALFIHWLRMGSAGIGLSIFLCRTVAAVILFVLLVKNHRFPLCLTGILKPVFIPSMIRRILNIGVPTGLEASMFQFGRLLTQRIFPFFGTSIIAANAVTTVINSLSFMTGNAFSIALLTVVGQCIGAGDYEAAKSYTAKIIKNTLITIFIICLLNFIFRDSLIGLFNLTPEAQAAARLFIAVHCVTMALGWTFSFGLPNALRAAGDAKYVMIVAAISMWTIRVSAAYLLTFTLGIGPIGVWFAMGGDFLFRGISYVLRWKSGRWQQMKVLDLR